MPDPTATPSRPRPPSRRPPVLPAPPRGLLIALVVVALVLALVAWWRTPSRPGGSATAPATGWLAQEAEARRATAAEGNLVYAGLPRSLRPDTSYTVLRNTGYVAGWSDLRREPLWVAYRLDPQTGKHNLKRPARFTPDPRVAHPGDTHDYDATGYDRGHLAPNAAIAQRYGHDAQLETFFLTNICPQRPELNRKVWSRLEREEADDLAQRLDGVWVVDGPVFGSDPAKLPGGEAIPEAFYKILLDEGPDDLRLRAFLIPQDVRGNENPESFTTTVDAVERATGLDFFPALGDAREDRLEGAAPGPAW